jgi:hypothetical protein
MPNDDRSMDQLVEQLHTCLADAMSQVRSDPFTSPVSVAEIYQDLVPYRSVRSRLGFEMNADYEHTLLRMLAGERDLARLEPTEAREELRAELDTPNPNVGLFRKFAACDVWIAAPAEGARLERIVAPAPVAAALGQTEPRQEASMWKEPPVEAIWDEVQDAPELLLEEEVVDETDIVDQVLFEMPIETQPEEPTVSTILDPSNGRAEVHAASGHCAFCHSGLPKGRAVKFCPHCGQDQSMHPCGSCKEPLEADWRFCINCGTPSVAAVQST